MSRPRINITCSVENCEKPAHAKGWCRTHWTRMHLYGRLEKQQGIIKGNCTIDGCDLPIKAKGLCVRHYVLKRTTGRTEKLVRTKTKHPYYSMWFERRRADDLIEEWEDLYKFAEGIGDKPGDNFVLVKQNSELPYGPDNFKWLETLKKDELETNKEWWARKWADARKRNPDVEYERNLRRSFGIGLDEYLEKFKNQDGLCAICKNPETSTNGKSGSVRRLAVDHYHKSEGIRELLCNRCNMVLGQVNDDIDLLQIMIDYLKKHGASLNV